MARFDGSGGGQCGKATGFQRRSLILASSISISTRPSRQNSVMASQRTSVYLMAAAPRRLLAPGIDTTDGHLILIADGPDIVEVQVEQSPGSPGGRHELHHQRVGSQNFDDCANVIPAQALGRDVARQGDRIEQLIHALLRISSHQAGCQFTCRNNPDSPESCAHATRPDQHAADKIQRAVLDDSPALHRT